MFGVGGEVFLVDFGGLVDLPIREELPEWLDASRAAAVGTYEPNFAVWISTNQYLSNMTRLRYQIRGKIRLLTVVDNIVFYPISAVNHSTGTGE